jgi:hypothetical protein
MVQEVVRMAGLSSVRLSDFLVALYMIHNGQTASQGWFQPGIFGFDPGNVGALRSSRSVEGQTIELFQVGLLPLDAALAYGQQQGGCPGMQQSIQAQKRAAASEDRLPYGRLMLAATSTIKEHVLMRKHVIYDIAQDKVCNRWVFQRV